MSNVRRLVMERWVPPYRRKTGIPLRKVLVGLAIAFVLSIPVVYLGSTGNPVVASGVLLLLALGCLVPAVVARDATLERIWSRISWLSRG
jgi:hypothetical protein